MNPIDAFKAKVSSAMPSPEPDGDEPDGDEGMSPGGQALAAIKSGDASALEEAIRRCVKSDY